METVLKHRILLLSDGIAPPSFNPRLRCLYEDAVSKGYEVNLVMEKVSDVKIPFDIPCDLVSLYSGTRFDWIVKNVWSLLFDWKNKTMSSYVERRYGQRRYDRIICTAFHTFPLRAAIEFGRRHGIPVTLDIRDIVEQAPGNTRGYLRHKGGILNLFTGLYNQVNLSRRNRWLRLSDKVTTVSPWHVRTLKRYNDNTILAYNGYDSNLFFPFDLSSEQFRISYIGKFYGPPLQDPTMLFEALSELMDEIPFVLEVHTSDIGIAALNSLSEQYGLKEKCNIGGFVPNDEVLNIMRGSSILLVFSNKASDMTCHGMMTTKFFEALGVEKPVLCVRSDEECLSKVIKETNAGLAATEIGQIKDFVREKYLEWKEKGFTRQIVTGKVNFCRQNTQDLRKFMDNETISCK